MAKKCLKSLELRLLESRGGPARFGRPGNFQSVSHEGKKMHFRNFAPCALFAGAVIAGALPAGAQTFKSLGCKDVMQGMGRLCLQARVTYRKIEINVVDNKCLWRNRASENINWWDMELNHLAE